MKYRNQGGVISLQMAGIIAAVLGALAIAVWVQQLRVDAAVSAKENAEAQVKTANERISDIAGINKRLDDTITLLNAMTEVNKAQAFQHDEDNKQLTAKIDKVNKTLPVVKPKAEEAKQPQIQVETSFKRALAMQEAFCVVDPSNPVCQPPAPADGPKNPS